MIKTYHFRLNISYQAFLTHYNGSVATLHVVTDLGVSLRIAAIKFRPFLTHVGLSGLFCLQTDEHNKFISLHKLN